MEASSATGTGVVTADPATQHLFVVSPTLDEGRTLNPRPAYYSLGLEPSAFPADLGGVTDPSQARTAQRKGMFDAALRVPGPAVHGNLIWFFKGDNFYVYEEAEGGEGDEIGDPHLLADTSGGSFTPDWPGEFATGIDAAVAGHGSSSSDAWFFKAFRTFRVRLDDGVIDIPLQNIADAWPGVTGRFAEGIDAAIHGVGGFFGFVWLFKGPDYLRFDLNAGAVDVDPRPIAEHWSPGTWPAEFADGIDFAYYGTGAEAEKIFFARGGKFIRYNLKTDRVEEGPKPLLKNWPKLARFAATPQLFLVEQYAIHTFRGEMGSGGLVPGPGLKVAPFSSTEFFILTKKSETITTRTARNILESQTDEAVERFSEDVRNDESHSGSEGSSDFQLDASFQGEASMTLGGGEASADLAARTHSQDERNAFAKAIGNQTNRQRDETHETHREQVSTAGAEHQVDEQVETGFKQVVKNPTDKPLTLHLFQITQEYRVVTALVDAFVEFHNDDKHESRRVPVREIVGLLEECIVDPVARQRIAATIVDVCSNVVDHEGKTRSLLVPLTSDGTRFQVDPTIRSAHVGTDSQGNRFHHEVAGIIVRVDSPVVLTPNTAMDVIHLP